MKTYYVVCSSFYDSGRITCNLVDSIQAEARPEQGYKSTRRCDIYIDYFDTREEAQAFIEQSRMA